jgi:ABC-type uncharacterized transport system permease subunit
MSEPTRPTFLDRQKDAALADLREQQAERARVADIVLGKNGSRSHVTEVIKLGNDYVVEVTARDGKSSTWTTVVNGERGYFHHLRQEGAILHLIASRYDSNANSNTQAAFYAGRVLGIPATD